MTAGASTAERLRKFLREMSPAACAMLLRELEKGSLTGENFPGFELILEELRQQQRGSAPSSPRIEGLDRRFFQPLTPFLVDEEGSEKMRGRIARSSLGNIWTWVQRDLMTGEIGAHAENLSAAILQGDSEQAQRLAVAFQDRFVAEAEKVLKENSSDRKSRQKLVSQLGGEGVLDDLLDVIAILKIRDALAALAQRLPPQIKNFSDSDLQTVRTLFEHPAVQRPSVFPLCARAFVLPPRISPLISCVSPSRRPKPIRAPRIARDVLCVRRRSRGRRDKPSGHPLARKLARPCNGGSLREHQEIPRLYPRVLYRA